MSKWQPEVFLVLYVCELAQALSRVPLCNPRTVAHQASLSMRYPRQEYWSGLPFPSSRDLPDPGIGPASPVLADGSFTTV